MEVKGGNREVKGGNREVKGGNREVKGQTWQRHLTATGKV
jgi:hypothetical protein